MRKIYSLLLLIGIQPLLAKSQAKYDHKIIAVLPLKTAFTGYRMMKDSSMEVFHQLELKYAVQLQEALYQTITSDTNRLLVMVQPWEVTDSVLKQAGLDFLKLPYLDIAAITRLLKVDACIVTTVNRTLPARGGYGIVPVGVSPVAAAAVAVASAAASQAAGNLFKRDNKVFFFTLVDGKSGDTIWSLTSEAGPDDLTLKKDGLVCTPRLFWRFKKRFPYCD
jgi:hypothetical protein